MADSSGRILDAAESIAAEDPDQFTIDRVSERAGVSRATVYRKFGGRDGLVAALKEERGVDAQATIDTRSRILESAAVEFKQSGIHGASIAAIAERAGVNPQSVYNHFGDKETLLTELLADEAPKGLVSATATAAAGDPDQAIRAFVHGAVELSREQHDLLSTVLVPDPITKRAFQRSMAQAGDATSHLAAALEHADLPEGISAEFAATSLMGMIVTHSTLLPALTGVEPEDRAALADAIATLFLRAISDTSKEPE